MPLNRPTLDQLIARAVADIEARIPGSDPLLRHSVLGALGRMHAGAVHGLYGNIDFVARQIIPATAEGADLERWATVWGVSRTDNAKASGNADFTGSTGAEIPSGLQLQSSNGVEYVTTEAATLDANGEATVAIEASEPGEDGNLDAGAALNLVTPLDGVDGQAFVATGGLTGGSDVEDDETLRERLLQRIQNPPHGGTKADYERWSREVAGVERVWVVPLYSGDGTVRVWIDETDHDGTELASAALVSDVQAYIDERRPVTADVTVAAPTVVAQTFDITLVPDDADVRAAVETELDLLFARDAEPEGTILLSRIREAVSIAAGESDNTVNSPTANVTAGTGEILTRGTVTWS